MHRIPELIGEASPDELATFLAGLSAVSRSRITSGVEEIARGAEDRVPKLISEASPDELATFLAGLSAASRSRVASVVEEITRGAEDCIPKLISEASPDELKTIMTDTQISDADIRAIFDKFDHDKSGHMDTQELGDAMRLLGMNPTEKDLQNVVAEVDHNNNGVLEVGEFTTLMRGRLRDWLNVDQITELTNAFASLDSQGSGKISMDQLKEFMFAPGEDISTADLEQIRQAGRADSDGMIDYKALVPNYFFGGSGAAIMGVWESVSSSVSAGYANATSSLPSTGELLEGGKSAFSGALGTLSTGVASATAAFSSNGGEGLKDAMPTGPICYLTSTGFVTDSQWARFIKIVLKRRGALQPADEGLEDRAALVAKYVAEIQKLKVTYINDASYHRPPQDMAKGRSGVLKVGEKHLGRGEGTWFWWDQGLEDLMGVPPENITMVQLLEKPWLFNHPERLANTHSHAPNRKELDPEDEKKYRAALQLTQDAYDALKREPPEVGAGQAGKSLPGCPASGLSCANELCEISQALNTKYAAALDDWCTERFDNADIVVGQGGEVVMLNMAWQCNQKIASRLVEAVRTKQTIYAGLSASTMVCAKSMEMTGEIQPGWIEAFAADAKYLSQKEFSLKDLDGDGINTNVLGALPMLEAPVAMRPHYSQAWEEQVLAKNLIAEKEFEEENGIEVPDDLVRDSKSGCEVACRLLTLISKASKTQDHPVFVPIRNGKVIEVNISMEADKCLHENFATVD